MWPPLIMTSQKGGKRCHAGSVTYKLFRMGLANLLAVHFYLLAFHHSLFTTHLNYLLIHPFLNLISKPTSVILLSHVL